VLLTVPSVLGTDLTPADLLEFVGVIADGAAAARSRPPAVQRILNSKVRACGGRSERQPPPPRGDCM
jgi:hypothetical protein